MSFTAKFFRRQKESTNPLASMLSMGHSLEDSKEVSKSLNGLSSEAIFGDTYQPSMDTLNKSSARNASISTISGLHSHRNVKPVHQMLLAESMYDPSVPLNIKCRLNQTLRQTFCDSNIFPYFLQFMESLDKKSKDLIRFWIQSECLINCETNNKTSDQSLNDFKKQFINDSIQIYDNYLSDTSTNCIDIPQNIKIDIKSNICSQKYEPLLELFRRAQNMVIDRIEREYYDSFLKSSYYCKYELDLLTTGSVTLADILFNNNSLSMNFIEFMEIEGMKSYADFLIMFENYRKVSNDYDDAIAIFNRFFGSDNTTNRLGFSEDLVKNLSEKLVKNNFSSDCMDRSAAILIQYFEKTYLKQFIESQLFIEYLNNCFQTLHSDYNNSLRLKAHKRTQSDSSFNSECSFVSSIGADQTSNPSPNDLRHRSSHSGEDFKSDSLWKRDLSGKLQFTHIDKYGRISSQLEPEPDRNTGDGPLSKVMKKLSLHSSTDKEREEIAWKIATMIINDVNNCCNGSLNTQ